MSLLAVGLFRTDVKAQDFFAVGGQLKPNESTSLPRKTHEFACMCMSDKKIAILLTL